MSVDFPGTTRFDMAAYRAELQRIEAQRQPVKAAAKPAPLTEQEQREQAEFYLQSWRYGR